MIRKIALIAPAALLTGALFAAPASAAIGNGPAQIRSELAQLDRQIDRARGLSDREERQLERAVERLQADYRSYARGGFNRGELAALNRGIVNLRGDLYRANTDSRASDRHDERRDDRQADRRQDRH